MCGIILVLALAAFPVFPAISPVQAGGIPARAGCTAEALSGDVTIRGGPDEAIYDVTGTLHPGEVLPVMGRSPARDWLVVRHLDLIMAAPVEGWIRAGSVTLSGACDDLPVRSVPDLPPEYAQLMAIPVLPESLDPRLDAIAARGRDVGQNPRAFTKVGDCNTASPYFLAPFDQGAYGTYDLGPYAALQPTVDYFAGWWAHESLAGQVGLNALAMLDPLFANPQLCESGEGLLACEYRRTQPAAAVMMFGLNDMLNLDAAQFENAVREIV
ncbi:MAG: hypothetical protein JXQ72_11580, partial [Anaerolineae bacterium]|nr:hypothetical protein [Anaerolineae bacterium]